jgi:5-methylcytosine-specific restriction enzyme subunit McrC
VIELRLVEGGIPLACDLPDDVAEGLRAAATLTVYPLRPGRWEVSDAGKVGVTRLGDVTVWIRPKIAIDRLLWLLGYAKNPGWKWSGGVGFEPVDELVPALAEAFASLAERALLRGLLQGYQEIDDSLPVLRGRLRADDQLRERYGVAVPLLVRYDDRTVDIAENQLLRGAVERLLRLPGVPTTTLSSLRRLRRTLYDVTIPPLRRPLPAWQETRLNARYHNALRFAEIVLAGDAVDYDSGEIRLDGFLVHMAKVFEDFVTATLTDALVRLEGVCRPQDRWYLDEADEIAMRPDLVWYVDGMPAAVIDAKYKAEKPAGFPDADLYQLLAYATALRLSEGHLVYAQGNETASHWQVRHAGVRITAHTLDLEAPPDIVLAQVDALARRIAGRSMLSAGNGSSSRWA